MKAVYGISLHKTMLNNKFKNIIKMFLNNTILFTAS